MGCAFVVYDENNRKLICDGQQRIITLSLLLNAAKFRAIDIG